VANVSHELRTPLTSVQGFAETLLDGALEDKEFAHKFVENIYNQTQRMTALVQDLLCLSQIESGKIKMQIEPRDLRTIIRSAMDVISGKLQKRGITINFQEPDKPIMLAADSRYFSQVIINLLDNAIKFSSPNQPIELALSESDDSIVLSVKDYGCGIPSEDLPRIFERFYRVDKSRSDESEGTGLGLAIVKHIVEVHNGHIKVESDLGKGTTFILTFSKLS
jgi:two-component system phosphate regulon sensor histidine kinase PhoR